MIWWTVPCPEQELQLLRFSTKLRSPVQNSLTANPSRLAHLPQLPWLLEQRGMALLAWHLAGCRAKERFWAQQLWAHVGLQRWLVSELALAW